MERYPTDFDHGEVSFSLDTNEFQSCSCSANFSSQRIQANRSSRYIDFCCQPARNYHRTVFASNL